MGNWRKLGLYFHMLGCWKLFPDLMYRQITGKEWMWHLVVTDLKRQGKGTASNLSTGDSYKDVKQSRKIRTGGTNYLIHHGALGILRCLRKFMLDIWLWGLLESKIPLSARESIHIHIHCFIFIQCRGGWGFCRQIHLSPKVLRRWRKTPPMWARKWDCASPWEITCNVMAPIASLTQNWNSPWEDRDSERDFFAIWCGQKTTSSWTGLLDEWLLQLQEMKEQKGGSRVKPGSWLSISSDRLHLQGGCSRSGHCTQSTALLQLLAGSGEVSHSSFRRDNKVPYCSQR